MQVRLIGVDWSTDHGKCGVAVVDVEESAASLAELCACSSRRTALRVVADAIGAKTPAVLAIDAPLGWPEGLSRALVEHAAGERLPIPADAMFSRETDHFVRARLGKRPLEVGANLIARTAHSANAFLADLRAETKRPVPLLWSPEELRDAGAGAIEVYPTATRRTVGADTPAGALHLEPASVSFANAHVEDALWCAVAALHFVRGECHLPQNVATSRREGWIWFRREVSHAS